jgi:PEGA domain-containing protein/protein kinase-like protein
LGPVFRAYDATRERLVAVKLFTLDLPPERVHQLVAELERVVDAQLDHPALCAPLGAGIVGASAYLAQEYVAADSLDSVVREYGAAPPADALRVAAQLAGALDFAGVVNIAHGAMHPRDILLSSDDTRLTGVGVARALEKVGFAAPVRRPYTAPERVAGGPWDRRADVFSLATVVHELLWAKRPAGTGARAAEALTDVEGGDLDALRAAFERALAEDPADRFETGLAFAQALSAAFPDIVIAPPEPRAQSARHVESRLPLIADSEPAPEPLRVAAAPGVDHTPSVAAQAPIATVASQAPVAEADPAVLVREEENRYRDVEAAPAIVADEPPPQPAPAPIPESYERAPISALERSRSAVWPLALALGVGLAVGFAGGYGVGTHSRPDALTTGSAVAEPSPDATPAPAATAAAPPATTLPPPSGREFTENSVPASPKPPPPPAPTSPAPTAGTAPAEVATDAGRILVRTTPAGARVSVDGKDYGRTPAAIRDLTRGAHRVRVARDGYAPVERRVMITAARPSQSLTIPMTREADIPPAGATPRAAPPTAGARGFAGSLVVDSRPPGAKVYVDGRLAGTTPLAMNDVRAGEHAIRLERDGYRRWSSSVRIVAAEQNRVTASLER